VVASDLPEIASIVRSYEIGVLCNPEDPQDIARAIKEALTPYRYATFKANLKRAQEELNWERESQKLKDLYLGLIRTGR
jgi:glycosyltransferase involved in cell wall biosynthesis